MKTLAQARKDFIRLRKEGIGYDDAIIQSGYSEIIKTKEKIAEEISSIDLKLNEADESLSEPDIYTQFSEETKVSPQLAKRIIDNLQARGLDLELFNMAIWKIKDEIREKAIEEKLNKSTDEEIGMAIDEILEDRMENCIYNEILSEISLSDEFSEEKEYELITTAKQTDHRYGDFEYKKEDLQTMAKNFNDNIVGTEIPVDLNHDPEHIAYAWIKPGSMKVKKSSKLDGEYSLYAQLYKFTPEGKDMVSTGKVRYFSLQIQNKFEKFVDKGKKIYSLVIRALALTNMPVIKDMAPILSESNILFVNHTKNMEREAQLEKELREANVVLSEKDKTLAETTAENKRLSEELAKVNQEKREKVLAEGVEKLCLSENKNIAFKGGEKDKILDFVKTLSDEQATAYFELHEGIITGVDLGEHGEAGEESEGTDANKIVEAKAVALSQEKGISLVKAYEQVLSENPELAKQTY